MKKLTLTLGAAYLLSSAGVVLACDGHKGAQKSTDGQKSAKKQKAGDNNSQAPAAEPTKS